MALLTFAQQQIIKPISKNNERHYLQLEIDTENLYLNKILGFIFASIQRELQAFRRWELASR